MAKSKAKFFKPNAASEFIPRDDFKIVADRRYDEAGNPKERPAPVRGPIDSKRVNGGFLSRPLPSLPRRRHDPIG